MKKLFSIAATLVLFSTALSAQTYVNAGIGRSYRSTLVDGADDAIENPATAYIAGVSHNFNLPFNLGVEVGINFQYDYDKAEMNLPLPDCYNLIQRTDIIVPVELNYGLDIAGLFDLKFFAGPTFFYGLSDLTTTYVNGSKTVDPEDMYEKGTHDRFMFAGSVGAALETAFGVRVKVDYMKGFTDMYHSDIAVMKQNLLSFTIGYAF